MGNTYTGINGVADSVKTNCLFVVLYLVILVAMLASLAVGLWYCKCFGEPIGTSTATGVQPRMCNIYFNDSTDILQLMADAREHHEQTEIDIIPDLVGRKQKVRVKRELTMEKLMAWMKACPYSWKTNQASKTESCKTPPVIIIVCGFFLIAICPVGIVCCISNKNQNKRHLNPEEQATGTFIPDPDETETQERETDHNESQP